MPTTTPFVPDAFDPPTTLATDRFRLEPLGPQHNEADLAAWTSSIAHIRKTPGYPDGSWPPLDGMSSEANLADLTRHAADFAARRGFTFTVLEPGAVTGGAADGDAADGDAAGGGDTGGDAAGGGDTGGNAAGGGDTGGDAVIGCVYLYPPERAGFDVTVQSWVRADRAALDGPLADAVAAWIESDWPWRSPDRCGR